MLKMKKWKKVTETDPPRNGDRFWGYDVFYDAVHICTWDGENINDDNEPFPVCADINGDDYSIKYWMEMEKIPEPPNVEN